jgi:4-alpha-glucanotransferase
MIRTVLRHAGGIRVDHMIGLFRLWWVPNGLGPDEGTYVRYDHEAMVGILALEAERAGAVVVGEDLGNVEPWVRRYLTERGILGTSILWWEKDWDHAARILRPRSGAGSVSPRSPPMTCRRPRATSPASTSASATSSGC